MFCQHCGSKLLIGAQFCPACGTPSQDKQPVSPSQPKERYAGFWRRSAALLVDSMLFLGVTVWLSARFLDMELLDQVILGEGPADDLDLALLAGQWFAYALAIQLLYATYTIVLHASRWQATMGKQIFGIKVTDMAGHRITLGRSVGRYLATWLEGLTLGFGYLLAGFSQRRQALHDMVSGTLVISRQAGPREVDAGLAPPQVTGGVLATNILLAFAPIVILVGFGVIGILGGQTITQTEGRGSELTRGLYVEIINQTGYNILEAYISPVESNSWEEDVLDETLPVGASTRIDLTGFDSPMFDIKLVDEDGDSYTFPNVDVSKRDITARPEDLDVK